MNVFGWRDPTINIVLPLVVYGLSVANVAMAIWPLDEARFVFAAAFLTGMSVGLAWALERSVRVLREATPAPARILLYLSLTAGLSAASWDLVPPMFEKKSEEPLSEPPVPAVVDEEFAIPAVPAGPERSADVPANVLELIGKAQDELRGRKMDVGSCGGTGSGQAQCLCDYLLAVTDTSGVIAYVEAYENGSSRPSGYRVKAQITPGYERACGTNPVLDVSHPPGQTVLAVRTVVKTVNGGSEAAVFTPFTDELNIPELRERGLRHWWNTVVAAQNDLRGRGVKSEFVNGALVADLIPPKHVFLLGIIENIGSLSPFGPSGTEEARLRELQAVLVMYGANGENAFKWRVSKAAAYGPLQFTSVYKGLARQYPSAGLDGTNWINGAKDHQTAARAAFLHSDEEYRPLRRDWYGSLYSNQPLYGLYMAAGYNGAARHASSALERCKDTEWYGATCALLRSETRWYLLKYTAVEALLFDPRSQARVFEARQRKTSETDETLDVPATD
jgi:hypothetical protein